MHDVYYKIFWKKNCEDLLTWIKTAEPNKSTATCMMEACQMKSMTIKFQCVKDGIPSFTEIEYILFQ